MKPEYRIDQENFQAVAEAVLGRGRSLSFRARGDSMAPWLQDMDLVRVAPLPGRPRLGDIVLVRAGDRLLLHRVIRTLPAGVVCRGDALRLPDREVVPYQAVFGRVVRIDGRGYNFHLKPFWGRFFARAGGLLRRLGANRTCRALGRRAAALLDQQGKNKAP